MNRGDKKVLAVWPKAQGRDSNGEVLETDYWPRTLTIGKLIAACEQASNPVMFNTISSDQYVTGTNGSDVIQQDWMKILNRKVTDTKIEQAIECFNAVDLFKRTQVFEDYEIYDHLRKDFRLNWKMDWYEVVNGQTGEVLQKEFSSPAYPELIRKGQVVKIREIGKELDNREEEITGKELKDMAFPLPDVSCIMISEAKNCFNLWKTFNAARCLPHLGYQGDDYDIAYDSFIAKYGCSWCDVVDERTGEVIKSS